MFRVAESHLVFWKDDPFRKPLMIRGPRQVGKSYLIEKFGKKYFKQLVTVNFELEKRFIPCFHELSPQKIVIALELMTQQSIQPQDTLLFLDEIQLCPNAIIAL